MGKICPLVIMMIGSITAFNAFGRPAESLESFPKIEEEQIHAALPSETMHQIFQNLYHDPVMPLEPAKILSLKEYKEQLKALLAVEFSPNVEIGVDSVKTTLPAQKAEIVSLAPQLAPKRGDNAKGYGLEFRIKLD